MALLFWACVAPLCQAETWRIYVDDNVQATTQHVWQNPRLLKRADFEAAVRLADQSLAKYCNFRLVTDRTYGRHIDLYIVTASPDTSSAMIYRGGIIAGEWYQRHPGRWHSTVLIHDGWYPQKYSGQRWGFWYPRTPTVRSLAALILHEIGHANQILGWRHGHSERGESRDIGHVLRDNPPQATIDYLRRRFGPPR